MDLTSLSGHLAFLLIALSYLVRDILLLRILAVAASIAGVAYNYLAPDVPLWLVINWNLVFVAVNLFQISLLAQQRQPNLCEEEKEIYESIFHPLSPFEYLKLLRVAEWKSLEEGQEIARQDEELNEVTLIYNGRAEVTRSGDSIAALRDGDFVGEMSFVSGQLASASVIAQTPSRVLVWPKDKLQHLLERNPSIRLQLQSILGSDMAKKLSR